MGNNDAVSWFSYESYNPITDPRVMIFEHNNYEGISKVLAARDSVYTSSDLGSYNNFISSIVVPEEAGVILYSENMGAGETLTLYGPKKLSTLSNYSWNDKISSMKVFRLATYEPIGYWNHVQTLYGTGSISFSVTYGITYTNTVETS